MTPARIFPDDPRLAEVLMLIRSAFAYMEGRVEPPSSMYRLTIDMVKKQATSGEVWVIGDPIIACMFLTNKSDLLYLGKLAVANSHRRRGVAHVLVARALARAKSLRCSHLELETRVELVENQKTFEKLGFEMVGLGSHPGFDKATKVTFRKSVP